MADAPVDDIARVGEAERRFVAAIANIGDETVRQPSLLPGWTPGIAAAVLAGPVRSAHFRL